MQEQEEATTVVAVMTMSGLAAVTTMTFRLAAMAKMTGAAAVACGSTMAVRSRTGACLATLP
jgi:uncharacterized metal-binding protein